MCKSGSYSSTFFCKHIKCNAKKVAKHLISISLGTSDPIYPISEYYSKQLNRTKSTPKQIAKAASSTTIAEPLDQFEVISFYFNESAKDGKSYDSIPAIFVKSA